MSETTLRGMKIEEWAAEVERLRTALKRANSNMEEAERSLYLKLNALEAERDVLKAADSAKLKRIGTLESENAELRRLYDGSAQQVGQFQEHLRVANSSTAKAQGERDRAEKRFVDMRNRRDLELANAEQAKLSEQEAWAVVEKLKAKLREVETENAAHKFAQETLVAELAKRNAENVELRTLLDTTESHLTEFMQAAARPCAYCRGEESAPEHCPGGEKERQ